MTLHSNVQDQTYYRREKGAFLRSPDTRGMLRRHHNLILSSINLVFCATGIISLDKESIIFVINLLFQFEYKDLLFRSARLTLPLSGESMLPITKRIIPDADRVKNKKFTTKEASAAKSDASAYRRGLFVFPAGLGDIGPCVAKRHRPVEDGLSGSRILCVRAEIAESLELNPVARTGVHQAGL
jgi:hypothetical protein